MRRVAGFLQIAVIIAIVAGATLYACRWTSNESDPEDALPPIARDQFSQSSNMLVEVVRPETIETTVQIEATGTIAYRTTVDVVPQVQGRVVWVSSALRAGGEFKSGEKLFRLDDADAKLAVQQAKADMQSAYAEMRLTEAEREAAIQNYQLLHGETEVPALVAKEPQLARSEAAIERARTRVLLAELDLSRTEFSFPFDGKVITSKVSVGQLLRVGQAVGSVYDIRDVEAAFPVSTVHLASLEPVVGRRALIEFGQEVTEAVIERRSSELDARTRTSVLYARITDDSVDLIPGQFIQATIFGPTLTNVFLLPESAEQANQKAWVVQENQLKSQPLTVLDRQSDGLLVTAFSTFDGIVKGSLPDAQDGESVQVISN